MDDKVDQAPTWSNNEVPFIAKRMQSANPSLNTESSQTLNNGKPASLKTSAGLKTKDKDKDFIQESSRQ